MTGGVSVGIYQHLAALYPKEFREEYREDLVDAFARQLRDESVGRVWLRAIHDLIVTVPAQRLEAHMNRSSASMVAVAALSIAVGVLVLAALSGTGPATGIFLLVALVALVIATRSWKAPGSAHLAPRGVATSWTKFVVVGGLMLGVTIAGINVAPWDNGELPGQLWGVMMLSLVAGIALLAAGLALGIAHGFGRQHHRPKSA